MVTRVATVAFEGIEARAVDVQVQIALGTVRPLASFARPLPTCERASARTRSVPAQRAR